MKSPQSIIFTTLVIIASIFFLFQIGSDIVEDKKFSDLVTPIASSTHSKIENVDDKISSSTRSDISNFKNLASIGSLNSTYNKTSIIKDIKTPKGLIHAEIANTQAQHEQGLSGRTTLSSDYGMLFVFPKEGSYGFWMKDMNFSLDIIWIDVDKKVLSVSENISPDSYPNLFFPPSVVSYVLELNAGSARKFGISEGSILTF